VRLAHEGARPLSCDDACHHRRGSLGGEDYAMPVGTPLYAPCAGMARARVAGTGGWTVTITRANGDRVELMHNSAFVGMRLGGPAVAVLTGQHVAYSGGRRGAAGAGSSTGPHSHQHVDVRGVGRIPLSRYLTTTTAPAGLGVTVLPTQEGEPMFRIIRDPTTDKIYIVGRTGRREWVEEGYHVSLLLRLLAGGEMLAVEIDTCAAHMAAVNS
jgi:murein DD-endopeptidase MepM/ murein hydrolase activator NlpD